MPGSSAVGGLLGGEGKEGTPGWLGERVGRGVSISTGAVGGGRPIGGLVLGGGGYGGCVSAIGG